MPLSSATAAWISGTGGDKKIDYINPEIKFAVVNTITFY